MTHTSRDRQNCLVLPYTATTRDKAEEFSYALELAFLNDIETEIFTDNDRWGIAIVKGRELIDDPVHDKTVTALVVLLMTHDLTEATGNIDCISQDLLGIPAAQRALAKRARRDFRLEDKLDSILARLDSMAKEAAQTAPSEREEHHA